MIVLECNNDEFLVKNLGFSKKQVRHESCKGKVLKKIRITPHAVGMVDEDPQSTPPREMQEYIKIKSGEGIRLFRKKNDQKKKLVLISPYLEHWLLDRAKQNKIKPKDYALPDNPKKLHNITHAEKNKNFREFIRTLISADKEIHTLKKWLEEALQ